MRDETAIVYGGRSSQEPGTPDLVVGHEVAAADALVAAPTRERPKWGFFFWLCIAWLALLAFVCVFVNFLPFQSPTNTDILGAGINAKPSFAHWLGTDQAGRDLLSRLAWGARTSMIIGLCATAISIGIGGTLGMLSAYVRGRFDAAMSFFMYCGLAFPAIIAVLAILAFWGRSESHIILVLGLFGVPLLYRLIRAATLATATKEYITAAKSQGATAFRVLFHDIFPNVAPSLIAYSVFTLGGVIAIEGALAFLGLSVQPPASSWGSLISDASGDIGAPLVFILSPAIALFLTLVSLNYVGERIRVHFDPGEVKL